jgi:hypothetical protein
MSKKKPLRSSKGIRKYKRKMDDVLNWIVHIGRKMISCLLKQNQNRFYFFALYTSPGTRKTGSSPIRATHATCLPSSNIGYRIQTSEDAAFFPSVEIIYLLELTSYVKYFINWQRENLTFTMVQLQ